ncbi:MAG TPA: sigma 54-interacting transcriptional regulator [Kofleriaceae bacterium]|nr:sigma 54-interacting transcriptional regulator [Kofleriaceae bacterium]
MTRKATVYGDALDGGSGRVACRLVVIDGRDRDRGRAWPIADDELRIGTDAGCDVALADDRVSALHASVRADGARFVVRDLSSTNGTWYEGSRVTMVAVAAGSTLRVGQTSVRIEPEAQPLDLPPSQARRFGDLVGESLAMREVFAVLERVAASDATLLVEGETGTGKELVARAVHDASDRRRGPFVAVDCGALPEGLLESELFGHVKGAFTGAAQARTGMLVRANGGTLFLDELGRITPTTQARLLRVLEERMLRPLGGDSERAIDVRVIAASRDDLDAEVAAGRFRPDLLYRLAVVRVALPPLRARREDIAPLVRELLRRRGFGAGDGDNDGDALAGANLDRLVAHSWPGNIRELRNAIDRAIALAPGAQRFAELVVRVEASPANDIGLAVRSDLPYAEAKAAVLHDLERRYLADVLARTRGNLSAASRESGIDRKHLRALARKHGLIADEGT